MKQLITLLILWIPILLQAQPNVTQMKKSELAKDLTYRGDFLNCTRWQDALGENYLILSQSKIQKSAKALEGRDDFHKASRDKEIYACHYIMTADTTRLLWTLVDFQRDCPLDMTVEFLTEKPLITDLDNNGTAETWMVYQLGCRGDVSPLTMKLIMHQGQNKYAIRGTRKIKVSTNPDKIAGGEMTKEPSFNTLTPAINAYATELWTRYNFENLPR